jgi:hypothetical protein
MGYSRRDSALLVAALLVAGAWPGPSARAEGAMFEGPTGMTECASCGTSGVCGCCPYLPGEFNTGCPPQRPVWYFQTEAIALKRDASGDQSFQALRTREWTEDAAGDWTSDDTITHVLGTGDLDFGFQGGGRALVGRTLGSCHAIEASYFQVTNWDRMAFVRDATWFDDEVDGDGNPIVWHFGSLFSPFSDFGDPPIEELDYNHFATISYSSSLDNLECNLRRWLPMPCDCFQASLLVGARYMNIEEEFFYRSRSSSPVAGTTTTVTTDTDNSMVGVQIGAMFEFYVDPCWWIDCEIKGVAFNNSAGQSTFYNHQGDPGDWYVGRNRESRSQDSSAFALDLNLTATWQITPTLAVMGGYQALWVEGLVLASENFATDVDTLISGPAVLHDNGKIVYHGPHLGATWAF